MSKESWPRKVVATAIVFIVACDDPNTVPLAHWEVDQMVTAPVAAELIGGYFSQRMGGADDGDMSAAQARKAAEEWMDQRRDLVRSPLQRSRNAPVDWADLAICDRLFYAESPYAAPAEDIGRIHDFLGGYWVVPLCAGKDEQMVLWVPAHLHINEQGPTQPNIMAAPVHDGNDATEYLLAPEDVVRDLAVAAGARVTSRPKLYWTPHDAGGPYWLRWVATIESPVSVRLANDQTRRTTERLWIGRIYPSSGEKAVDRGVSAQTQPSRGGREKLRAGVQPYVEKAETIRAYAYDR